MSSIKQFALLALAACSGLFLVGCESDSETAPGTPTLVSIAVSPSSAELAISGTLPLKVTGTFSDSSTLDLTSASGFRVKASNPASVATVSTSGVVTALKAGTATIEATASGKTATASITVPPGSLVSIAVTPATSTVALGGFQPLTVTATYNEGSKVVLTAGVTFASSQPTVATVDAAGVVAAVAPGAATITATETASGKSAIASITVSGGGGGASGNTGTCTAPCIDFSGATVGLQAFEGLVSAAVANDPVDATNKVAKLVKGAAGQPWAGATVYTNADTKTVDAIGFATSKIITLRVYSPAVGEKIRLKVEDASDPTVYMEVDALTTKANEWETLTFDFTTTATGTYNPAKTYNRVSIFPKFLTAVSADTTYYFDELKYSAASGGGGGGGFVNGVFADDYTGTLPATAKSTQGGDVGFFFDPRLANGVGATYDYGGVSGTAQDPQGVHNFYYGLGLNLPAITDAYFGAYVKSPGNGTVNVAGFTNILVNVWGPDQLFQAGTFPALEVVLQGPAVGGCGSASGGSEVTATFNTTGQGADKTYTLPLSGFTLRSACSGEATVAQVLASIAQINIVLKNTNIQYVHKDPNNVAYTNGLNVGSLKFN